MSNRIKVQRVCQYCDEEFTAQTTVTKYCSHKCAQRAYKQRKKEEKINKSNTETLKKKLRPIEELKAKEFLTVREAAALLSCSVRSVYRLIENNTISATNLSERMTRINRSELDTLMSPKPIKKSRELAFEYDLEDCYTMTEIQSIYGISETALYDMVKRNNIPKKKKGWYSYVPKAIIDKLLKQA